MVEPRRARAQTAEKERALSAPRVANDGPISTGREEFDCAELMAYSVVFKILAVALRSRSVFSRYNSCRTIVLYRLLPLGAKFSLRPV